MVSVVSPGWHLNPDQEKTMTNHINRIPLRVTEAGIVATFEANSPSSMDWTDERGVVCTFDVNGNKTLIVDSEIMTSLADHTPLAGRTLLIQRTDEYCVDEFGAPEYTIYDTSWMDKEDRDERLSGLE